MCQYAPATLTLRRSARAINAAAAMFTTMPIPARERDGTARDVWRLEEPAYALGEEHDEHGQRQAVHPGGEDVGALEGPRCRRPWRAGPQPHRDQRECQRAAVGERVPGVGEQGERPDH